MTDREAFEACPDLQDYCDFSRCPDGTRRGIVVYNDPWTQGAWQGWQAALASERAKQSATTNVGIDWANPATLNGSALPAVQAEPVLLNLALRLRLARRCLKQAISSRANQSYIDQLRGAETEAWNSFQAAKAIAAPPAVQAEPVALHIDPITPDDRKRYYDFEKYADHLPSCKQPRGDQSCECGYSAVRTNLSDLLDELAAPAQQEPPQQSAEPVAFVITDEKINFLQVNSIKRFIERAKHAHFTDIYYRINGKDEVVEADWLKHLQLASPPADDEAVRLLIRAVGYVGADRELRKQITAYLAKVGK